MSFSTSRLIYLTHSFDPSVSDSENVERTVNKMQEWQLDILGHFHLTFVSIGV